MIDPMLAKATMQHLMELGISLSIDDFGTGYSSLSYLSHLPVSELKIDRSLLNGMDSDHRKAMIVKSTVELARDLGLRSVAEGIEDAETLNRIFELGCDLAQGFHLSRPLPADDFLRWFDARGRPDVVSPAPAYPSAA
jgi:EAL domain-containing protein (putative c-di-GMP-specific phosphodiesterase class I)